MRLSSAERRALLLQAALRVIAEQGVAGATTRAIVAEAGMSLASFHYAFRSHAEMMRDWLVAIRGRLQGLGELVSEVRDYEISVLSSGLEGNLEYDIQLQCRFLLMQNALSTTVEFLMAERLIEAVVGSPGKNSDTETLDQLVSAIFTAVFSRRSDEVRKLFPAFCRELGRRPLLYVPFENGGQPAAILGISGAAPG